MVRVEVKNFQSMVHQVVEIDGFSTVVGRSNVGKSAIVRAIKAALTGAPADSYVRHGASCLRLVKNAKTCKCFCSVRITGSGIDLLWEKGDTINRYMYNGVEYSVPGRGTPEFLGDGFSRISLGSGEKTLLQVSDQFDPLFLLNNSGTVVADVLSDVAKLDQINAATRLVEKDRKEAVAVRKVRDRDRDDLQKVIDGYSGLDSVLGEVSRIEELAQKVDQLEVEESKISRYFDAVLAAEECVRLLEPVTSLSIPDLRSLVTVSASSVELSRFERVWGAIDTAVTLLSAVDSVQVPNLTRLENVGLAYRQLSGFLEQAVKLKEFLQTTKESEAAQIPAVEGLPEKMAMHSRLAAWQSGVDRLLKSGADLKAALSSAEAEEKAAWEDVQDLVCPTCKQPITVEHKKAAHA